MNVEIRVMNAARQGVSASTGKPWKSQELVVAWRVSLADGSEVENITVATLHGEYVDRFAAMNAQVGQVVNADIAFGTRSYNGRVYCDNRIYI